MKNGNIVQYFIVMLVLILCTDVHANTINEIEMNVYLDSKGNAIIEEIWDATLNQGTEGYRAFSNLENKTITDYTVTDEKGIVYESLPSWNSSQSFEQKSNKSGINYTTDGLELCWGISNYGHKKYNLNYKINNLVEQYTDNQGIYFNFLNLDQKIGKVKITIYADFLISLDNSRIWSFGNNGTIVFSNGKIVMESNSGLSSNQYVVIMVRFNEKIFETSNKSIKSFDDIYKEAFAGVNKSEQKTNNNTLYDETNEKLKKYIIPFLLFQPILSLYLIGKYSSIIMVFIIVLIFVCSYLVISKKKKEYFYKWVSFISFFFLLIDYYGYFSFMLKNTNTVSALFSFLVTFFYGMWPIIRCFIVLHINSKMKNKYLRNTYGINNSYSVDKSIYFGEDGKKLPKKNDLPYYRDLPCGGDLSYAFWIAHEYGIDEDRYLYKGLIGAYFLKWINCGAISIIVDSEKSKENNYCLDFSKEVIISEKSEKELYDFVKKCTGDNKILESDEFKMWCTVYYEKIYDWMDGIKENVLAKLEKDGYVKKSNESINTIFGIVNDETYNIDIAIREDAIKLAGLKKFLDDITLISTKEPIEVKMWDKYLIYAELFGSAYKVRTRFKKLYPNIELSEQYSIFNEDFFDNCITTFVDNCYNGASKGYSIDHPSYSSDSDYSGSDSSSGGGGSSSSSGGSSSGGSSGGGFR